VAGVTVPGDALCRDGEVPAGGGGPQQPAHHRRTGTGRADRCRGGGGDQAPPRPNGPFVPLRAAYARSRSWPSRLTEPPRRACSGAIRPQPSQPVSSLALYARDSWPWPNRVRDVRELSALLPRPGSHFGPSEEPRLMAGLVGRRPVGAGCRLGGVETPAGHLPASADHPHGGLVGSGPGTRWPPCHRPAGTAPARTGSRSPR
jgi:hypothetical protein